MLLFGSDDADAEVFYERLMQTEFDIEFDNELENNGEQQQGAKKGDSETMTKTSLSFSLGWHTWDSSIVTAQNWVDAADEAMYKQKRQYKTHTGVQKVV